MKKFIFRLFIMIVLTLFQVMEKKFFNTNYLTTLTTVFASYYLYDIINKLS